MKRFGKRSAVFLLFFTLITGMLVGPWQPAAQAASSYHARVTVSTAKVHTSPSGRAHTVAKLHRNATVTVIGTRGSWKKISYGGKTRYIYAKYIKKSTPSYSFRSYTNYVKSYSLVMRSKASSHYRKIRSLYMNYKVTVIGAKGSYRYVQYGSRKGYVQAKWLKSTVKSYGAYVVQKSINLWKGPGKKYGHPSSLHKYLYKNNTVTVTGSSSGYLKVNYNGTKGYAWGGYFKNGTPPKAAAAPAPVKAAAPAPVKTSAPAYTAAKVLDYTPVSNFPAYIGYDNRYIYASADTNSSVKATLREKTLVTVIGTKAVQMNNGTVNWSRVRLSNGDEGYIQSYNLETDINKFNIPTSNILGYGLDISHHQNESGAINSSTFNTISAANYSFVIIKASEGTTVRDKFLQSNLQGALNATPHPLKVGAYHYFWATDESTARSEANWFTKNLNDAGFSKSNYVFIDVEENGGNSKIATYVTDFLQQMIDNGYTKLGIYSRPSYFKNNLNLSTIKTNVQDYAKNKNVELSKILVWLSWYRGKDSYEGPGSLNNNDIDIWQYTSNGIVAGVSGATDKDASYIDPNNF
ncbi:GH25 family lysozyme [Sporolactobacillus spathodeae]|uniref:GH25 family lysozyme M1 (1,4-beta-N-acetylmuramidase) n=1 Tax=Sporolactobacillus spathodeae TaxID=1465502 RepID=A0ABS2Q9Y6_9BACL|nr:GH25 family lysozyme M1 (1,4-beta-N-acetylmuramidase) [Sporolactobacillus spathodeae]